MGLLFPFQGIQWHFVQCELEHGLTVCKLLSLVVPVSWAKQCRVLSVTKAFYTGFIHT